MKFSRKILTVVVFLAVVLFVLGEFGLRKYGFLHSPLYIKDKEFGYAYAPNQHMLRFNNLIEINGQSMRSKPLSKEDKERILVIGDSVVNGGNPTDQRKLATTILENRLSKDFSSNIRVLNLSTGGWSIDNAAGFIKEKGDFNSKLLVLVFSSHDAFAKKAESKIVGVDPNFPDKQYSLATIELLDRYLIPKAKSYFVHPTTAAENAEPGGEPNPGWNYFFNFAKQKHIPMVILLHPEVDEVKNGEYNDGGKWIIEEAKKNHIPLIQELSYHPSLKHYRDNIHPDANGQKDLSNILYPYLKQFVKTGNIQ